MLPEELEIEAGDGDGRYADGDDCTIARAMDRLGHSRKGLTILSYGMIVGPDCQKLGYYKWSDGRPFGNRTAKETGTLVWRVA